MAWRATRSSGTSQGRLARVEPVEAVGGPPGVGRRGGDALLAGAVVEEAPGRVDEQHLARAEPAALDAAVAADVDGADLGAHGDEAVLAHLVAQGAQAVAVERGAHADAVGEDTPAGPSHGSIRAEW